MHQLTTASEASWSCVRLMTSAALSQQCWLLATHDHVTGHGGGAFDRDYCSCPGNQQVQKELESACKTPAVPQQEGDARPLVGLQDLMTGLTNC